MTTEQAAFEERQAIVQALREAVADVAELKRELAEFRRTEPLKRQELSALRRDLAEARAYADKLAEGLPCLPKDVEVLRDANRQLATELAELAQGGGRGSGR
jgi:chromosome segregation ATPase